MLLTQTVLIGCCRVWTTGRRCLLFWKEKHSACLKTEQLLHRYEHLQNISILLFRYSAILSDVLLQLHSDAHVVKTAGNR